MVAMSADEYINPHIPFREVEDGGRVYDLEGPISVDDELVWEPQAPWAFARLRVVEVKEPNSDGEVWITTVNLNDNSRAWNDEERVREACIRAADFDGEEPDGDRADLG